MDVHFQCELERMELVKFANAVKSGSLPDDAKMDVANFSSKFGDSLFTTVVPGKM